MKNFIHRPIRNKPGERGSGLVEFVLCFGIVWLPLFLGLSVFGFNIVRGIQVTQVCRDAGHMYAYGTDFSQTGGQNLLASLATGMKLTSTGNAKIILSTVTYIAASDCLAAGLQADTTHCPNLQSYVFARRVVVPSSSGIAFTSSLGSLSGVTLDSAGGVSSYDQLHNTGAQLTTGFTASTGISLPNSSQVTYVSEMYAQALRPIAWSSFNNPGVTARAFF